MNARSYKTVFSKRLGALVAVGEHASSQGKANGAGSGGGAGASGTLGYIAALTASFALVSLAWAAPATNALPTAGQVVQGAASMSQAANQLTINQSTQRAAINWQSFDIGAQAKVQVVQPNAQAVLLNRVVGQSPSQIFGQLNANGHVILVNPNGVLFGKDGSVNAASFTASTLGISDANFMAGNMVYERNGSTAGIVNEGTITTAPGGYVALLGASVSNQGKIDTQGGNAFLAAADTIKVPVSSTGRIKLELTAADMNANVSNSGSIITQGGQVYMQALALNQAAAQIIQSGSIDTTGEQGGAVHLLADGGNIKVDGSITANSRGAGNKGGDIIIGRDEVTGLLAKATDVSSAKLESQGGFVETSGESLYFNAITVKAKEWLLDPFNVNIDANAAATISSNLANTDITIETTSGGSIGTNTMGDGNITVNGVISKQGATEHTLTLTAANGIDVNQNIGAAAGAGKLNVVMTAAGNAAIATSRKGITLNKIIDANGGTVTLSGTNLNTGGNSIGVKFDNGSGITAASYNVTGVSTSTQTSSYGVGMFGTVKFKSTGNSLINGTSLSQSTALTYGTMIYDGANVSFDAGNTGGKLQVKGSNAAWETGFRIGGTAAATVTTDGDVTLGALEDHSQFSFRAGTVTANSGKLTLLGQINGGGTALSTYDGASITANNGVSIIAKGVAIGGAKAVGLGQNTPVAIKALQGTAAVAGDISITGISTSGSAIEVSSGSSLEAAKVTLNGTATSGAGVNGTGKITATTGNVQIDGLTTSGGTGGHVVTNNNITASNGDIVINGTTATTDTPGVYINSGNALSAKNIYVTGTSTGLGGTNQNAKGIRSWGILNATDKITLTGTSTNVTGIGIEGGSVTGGGAVVINQIGTSLNYQGVNIGAAVKGASVSITGNSRDHLGVAISASVTATNGDVNINGTSSINQGVAVNPTGSVKSDSGNITIEGTSNSSMGVFIGTNLGTTNIDANKNVTITGSSTSNTGVSLGAQNGNTAFIATIKSGGDTTVNGTGLNGVKVWDASSITANNINITGNAVTTTTAQTGNGVEFQRFPKAATLTANNDINIEGTIGGLGTGSGIKTSWSGQSGNGPAMTATNGNFTLRGNNRAATSNTQAAINADSGMQVKTGKNIVVQAETINDAARAMVFYSLGDMYRGNASFVSTNGDVLIQANKGGIVFNNQQTSVTGQLTDITGRNITIDNTGAGMATGAYAAGAGVAGSGGTKGASVGSGSIDLNTGAVTTGAGKANAEGVNISDLRNITASGQLNIMGVSRTSVGVSNIAKLTGGTVNIKGISEGAGSGISTSGLITSTVGDVNLEGISVNGNGVISYSAINAKGNAAITGTSTGTGGSASALSVWGNVTADQNVTLKGTNAASGNNLAAVFTNKAITATNGKIDVTASTAGASANALQLHDGANLTAKTEINLKADTLSISTATTPATINAGNGAGIVTIKTDSTDAKINVGASDAGSVTTNARTLGLTKAELDRITAGKTVIGDANNTGGITVSAATTTLAQTGDITLHTAGNIAVTKALTVGDAGATKNLTVNGAGPNSTITQAEAIKANGLELLGANATHTLNNSGNKVVTLAADVKKVEYTNSDILKIDTVNGTSGINAKDGVSVTTRTGNLIIDKAITNTSSWNVIVGAGVSAAAGNTALGDVKTKSGATITTQSGGKTLVYTGSAAGTGLLQNLTGGNNTAFSDLKVTGDASQNTDTFRAFDSANPAAGIGGSTATAQVMFREKVTITNGLVGTTLEKTYGDAKTENTVTAKADLLTETKAKLKQEGGNLGTLTGTSANYTTPTAPDGNVIKIAKSVIIDSLTGNLDGAGYSGARFLKANGDYAYNRGSNSLTSNKYTIDGTTFTDSVKVTVAQKALTGSIGTGNTTYGDALVPGAVSLSGVVSTNTGADNVIVTGVNIDTIGKTSASGKLNAGTYAGIQSVAATGEDAANYSFANVKGDYKVDQRQLTINKGAVVDKTADGTTTATVTPGTLNNLVGNETLGVAATGVFSDASAGNGKAVKAFYTLQNGSNGGVVSNYILNLGTPTNPDTRMTGNILTSVNPVINPTPSPVNNNTGSRVSTVSGFGGSGAATGVLDDKPVTESREVCSDVFPENCECQPSVIPTIEICFAPKRVAATKEEK